MCHDICFTVKLSLGIHVLISNYSLESYLIVDATITSTMPTEG